MSLIYWLNFEPSTLRFSLSYFRSKYRRLQIWVQLFRQMLMEQGLSNMKSISQQLFLNRKIDAEWDIDVLEFRSELTIYTEEYGHITALRFLNPTLNDGLQNLMSANQNNFGYSLLWSTKPSITMKYYQDKNPSKKSPQCWRQ